MKLFLYKIFSFFLISFFLILFYEKSLSFVPNSYKIKKKVIEKNRDSIEMVVVGTSHVFGGIIPSKMTKNTVNIANNSQSIYYDIELLNKYIHQLPNLETIVFEINFFTFEYNLDNGPEAWRALYYKNFFNIDPQTKELSFSDNFLVKMYSPKDITYHIGSIPLYEDYYKGNGVALSSEVISNVSKEVSLRRYNHLVNKYMLKSEKEKTIEELEIFLENLTNTRIKVFFVQVPISSTMYSYIDKKLLFENNNLLKNLCGKYPNVKSINMLNDMRFSENDFRDCDHLNPEGAIKFSTLLNAEINTFNLD